MNSEAKNIYNLWPLTIGNFHNYDHPLIKDELLNFFKSYEKKLPEGNSQLTDDDHVGNHNLYQSNYDLHNENSEVLRKLFHFIAESVLTVSKKANQSLAQEICRNSPKKVLNV